MLDYSCLAQPSQIKATTSTYFFPTNSGRDTVSYHRDVKGAHVGKLGDLTGDVLSLAQCQGGDYASGAGGILDVLQTLGPCGGTHQPQEGYGCRQTKVLKNKGMYTQSETTPIYFFCSPQTDIQKGQTQYTLGKKCQDKLHSSMTN